MAFWAAIVAMGLVGGQLALQAPLNSRLGRTVGSIGAAMVNNLVGTVLLIFLCLVAGELSGLARIGDAPAWALTGGVFGAFLVASSTVTVARLGAGTIAAALIAGDLASSLAIDGLGWFGLDPTPVSAVRLAGVFLVFGGTLLVTRVVKEDWAGFEAGSGFDAGSRQAGAVTRAALRDGPPAVSGGGDRVRKKNRPANDVPGEPSGDAHVGLVLVMVFAGVLIGAQPPVNSALAGYTGGLAAALVNFLVGGILLVALLVSLGGVRRLRLAGSVPRRYLLGGFIGVVAVTVSLLLVDTIGATALAAAVVSGQLLASIGLDRLGVLGLRVRGLTRSRLTGVVLLIAGTVLTAV